MAAFRKIGDRWAAEVCVNGIRKSKRHDTKAQANSWAAQIEVELGKMADGVSTTHLLKDVFSRYAREISESKKGAQWEIVRLKMFERFAIANVLLADLRREHFEIYIAERLTSVKTSSVNRELNLISHCLTQARRWRLMSHNPIEDLQRPKDPPHRDRRISDSEIEQILVALCYSEKLPVTQQQQKVAIAFLLAIQTGMRAGELCSLQPRCVDLNNRTAFLTDTKNGHARYVPLSQEAVRLLRRTQPWGEYVLGLDSGTLSTLFKRAVGRTDIENLTFHDSRHEAITRLAGKLDVLDLARTVGHRDIKQLMTYYNKSAAELAVLLG